jgi:translation elongation factor P/translation initiation factor 5A
MKKERLKNKFKNLKVGDKVVLHESYSTRTKPREYNVTKIGRQYIYIDNSNTKFSIEHGYGEYGMSIFPGTIEEYNEQIKTNEFRKIVINEFERNSRDLTKEELIAIMEIIKEE